MTLTELQRDALRELANVGAGHAATALSAMLLEERLAFLPPEAWTGAADTLWERLGRDGLPSVAAVLDVQGDVKGALWLAWTQPDAERLAARLAGTPEPDQPAVEEAVKALARQAGADALFAMGRLTGLVLRGGEPGLRRGPEAATAGGGPPVLGLEVRLRAQTFTAVFLFVPEASSLDTLLRSLRV